MQQRVGLARAFATDADILLMDEPFSSLDPLIRTKLQDELLALQSRVKKTILFVSHDLDEALRLGNQISILEGGRILQTGTVQDIVLRPAHARVAEFVQHMNPLHVLRGDMVMRHRDTLTGVRNSQELLIDTAGRYLVSVDHTGCAASARLDGQIATLRTPGAPPPADGTPGIYVAPSTLTLQQIVELCARSGHPVLLQEDGKLCGVCGEAEILRALAGSADASGSHSPL
jgi:glycine betaine/proline transport system ATP-binding protein